MESFQVLFSKQAQKDIALLTLKQKDKFKQIRQVTPNFKPRSPISSNNCTLRYKQLEKPEI